MPKAIRPNISRANNLRRCEDVSAIRGDGNFTELIIKMDVASIKTVSNSVDRTNDPSILNEYTTGANTTPEAANVGKPVKQ